MSPKHRRGYITSGPIRTLRAWGHQNYKKVSSPPSEETNPKLASTPTQGLSSLALFPSPSNYDRANEAQEIRQVHLARDSPEFGRKIGVMGKLPSKAAISRKRRPTPSTLAKDSKFARHIGNYSKRERPEPNLWIVPCLTGPYMVVYGT
jgi:hypothetical protein